MLWPCLPVRTMASAWLASTRAVLLPGLSLCPSPMTIQHIMYGNFGCVNDVMFPRSGTYTDN